MRLKSRAGHRNDNSGQDGKQDGKKKQKSKGFHEAISDMRSQAQEAELTRRRAASDAAAKAAEDEVARMTYGPAYRDGE
jgi:hypothetical protein